MKTIIAGSRGFNDYQLLKQTCDKFNITEVVFGGAKGADALGKQYAEENNLPIKPFLPDWSKGRRAALYRNIQMAEYGEQLIAFHDGKSTGTLHMISQAKKRGLPTYIITYPL